MTVADAALLSWGAVLALVYLVAIRRSLRCGVPSATSRPPSSLATPLLVVRPCAGDEAALGLTLGSLGALVDDPAHRALVRLRYAVATAGDAAVPAIVAACERFAALGVDAALVVTGATAPNQKSDQLARVLALEPHGPVVVTVDSDVDLRRFDWEALLSPLRGPGVAAVWAPPHEAPGESAADRASEALLGGSLHSFALLAGLDPGGLVGKVLAVRRAPLEAVGGFGALRQHLGEDMELSRRLRASGASVAVSEGVAEARCVGRSGEAVVARYGRWVSVIRAQRPLLLITYPALFFATPLVAIAAVGAALSGGAGRVTLAAAALVGLLRLAVAWAAARATGRGGGAAARITDALLADALLARAFARALATRTVRWRGRKLRIDRRGELHDAP